MGLRNKFWLKKQERLDKPIQQKEYDWVLQKTHIQWAEKTQVVVNILLVLTLHAPIHDILDIEPTDAEDNDDNDNLFLSTASCGTSPLNSGNDDDDDNDDNDNIMYSASKNWSSVLHFLNVLAISQEIVRLESCI